MSRAGLPVILLAAGLWCAARPAAAQTVGDPALELQVVATGLASPTSMAFIGPDDILVLEKEEGRVRRIFNGVLAPGFVLDVAVDIAGERGLLGIAVDPDFAVNRHVFLYYTESSTGLDTRGEVPPLGNRIYRYHWDGSQLVNPLLIADLPVLPGPNHDGGVIAFGPDGALYGVIGDQFRAGKLQNVVNGAGPDDTGVILRVDPRGLPLADNPFYTPADPAAPVNRYFAYGIRNSFGLAFDARTGDLWDTENGPSFYDEINRVVPGFNSGWNLIMGPDSRDPDEVDQLWSLPGSLYRDPEFSWSVPVAPTALVFPASPVVGCSLKDDLLVADSNCGRLYRFRLNPARDHLLFTSTPLQDRVADNLPNPCSDEMEEILFGAGFATITDLENGPDGRLYIVDIGFGTVFRISPRAGAFPDADGDGVDDACDCAPSASGWFASPGEIARLRLFGASPHAIDWDSPAATTGPGTTSQVVSGLAGDLRQDGGYARACTLAASLSSTAHTDARPDPPIGEAWYYLVRPRNSCGSGTFGNGTPVPDPRDLLDLATPPDCITAGAAGTDAGSESAAATRPSRRAR